MNIRIDAPVCFSEIGQRSNQEDALFPPIGKATNKSRVYMVCDGMGGHEDGEVASRCVADTIGCQLASLPLCTADEMREHFEKALSDAYRRLDELDKTSATARKMGTTLTLLALCRDSILVAHIGDSRVYQLRPGEGVIFQTHDHSLVNDLIASGELSAEDASCFEQKNVITRAIMPHQEYQAKASFNVITDVHQGDVFFLCSDGIVEQLDNMYLSQALLAESSLRQRVELVRQECASRITQDNHTCYAFEVLKAKSDVKATTKTRLSFRLRFFILLAVALMVALFGLSLWMKNSNKELKRDKAIYKTERVQGTISRQKYKN